MPENHDQNSNTNQARIALEKRHLLEFLNLDIENIKLLREREQSLNSQNKDELRISEINRILEINKNIKTAINKGFVTNIQDIYWTLTIKENSEHFKSQSEGYKNHQTQGLSWLELGLHDKMTPEQIKTTMLIGAYQTYCENNNLSSPKSFAEIDRGILEAQNLENLTNNS